MKIFLNNKIKNQKQSQNGFTLLEAMVSVAIFSIIMVIGVSSLLSVNSAQKKSRNLRTIIDTLSFVTEDISRNFKLGSAFHCYNTSSGFNIIEGQVNDFLVTPQDCDLNLGYHLGSLAVALEPTSALPNEYADPVSGQANAQNQVIYMFEQISGTNNCMLRKSVDGGQNFSDMLPPPPDLEVSCSASGFNIYNTQASAGYGASPRIIIRISGQVNYKDSITPFNIQTSASQRNISIVSP